jgi:hypothetical protein
MKVPAFIHLFASVYAATRCSVDFYAYEVVRHLLPQLYDRVMQDPANELLRIPILRTPVNKGVRAKGGPWGNQRATRERRRSCSEGRDPPHQYPSERR